MSFKVMAWASRVTEGLNSTSKFVLLMIADRASDEGFCFPSIESIMKDTLLSKRAVIDSIHRLEELEYIKIERRHRKANIYQLLINDSLSAGDAPKAEVKVQEMHPSESLGAGDALSRVQEMHPNLSLEPINQSLLTTFVKKPPPKTDGKRRGTKLPIDFEFPADWVSKAAMEMRCSAKAVDSDRIGFIHYYTNGKGKNESCIDWLMTWRNWYRKPYSACSKEAEANTHAKHQKPDNSVPAKIDRAIAERNARRQAEGAGPSIGTVIEGEFDRIAF